MTTNNEPIDDEVPEPPDEKNEEKEDNDGTQSISSEVKHHWKMSAIFGAIAFVCVVSLFSPGGEAKNTENVSGSPEKVAQAMVETSLQAVSWRYFENKKSGIPDAESMTQALAPSVSGVTTTSSAQVTGFSVSSGFAGYCGMWTTSSLVVEKWVPPSVVVSPGVPAGGVCKPTTS
jgi:hypothetical protein